MGGPPAWTRWRPGGLRPPSGPILNHVTPPHLRKACRAGPAAPAGHAPVISSRTLPRMPGLPSMGTYALGSVFAPASVALVGGSPRERSLGRLVLGQIVEGGFPGRVGVVNARYPSIAGVDSSPRLDALGFTPELVIIATPPSKVAKVAAAAADA